MKIIFLDIDGVLNPIHHSNALFKMWKASFGEIKSKDEYGELFLDQNCNNLKKIIDHTGAKIVISSDWGKEGLQKMKDLWEFRGLAGEIIDVTPKAEQLIEQGYFKESDNVTRGMEIRQWIKFNNFTGNYVIIDDIKKMLKSQTLYFVLTNMYCGLTEKDADKAIKILNS